MGKQYFIYRIPANSVQIYTFTGSILFFTATGNNYGSCAYLVFANYYNVLNTTAFFNLNISADFSGGGDTNPGTITATVTNSASYPLTLRVWVII